MRIAYLECFSGISGDMFLGALVDAGVPPRVLAETISALDASAKLGARLEVSRVVRSGISATKVDVYVHGEKELPREEYWEQQRQHEHEHSQGVEHHHHEHSHSHAGEVSRTKPARSAEVLSEAEGLAKGVSAPHDHEHSHE